ncbi:MAG: PDZ domain-containing protein [Actinomycetota bacterium]|nr:PDZ domain-containing protein [Actinomycetota bacterium]
MQGDDWDLPTPPGTGPVRGTSVLRIVVTALVAAAIVIGTFVVPIPVFFLYVPGPVRDVGELVEVEGAKTYSSEGRLYLTTINIKTTVTLFDVLAAAFDPARDVVMKEEVTGGQSIEDVRRQAEADMTASKQAARKTALGALGIPAGDGARVVSTFEGTPAEDALRKGDVVVGVDGRRITSTCDVVGAFSERSAGDVIRMTVVRAGRRRTIPIETIEHPAQAGAPFAGFEMADVLGDSIAVKFKTGEIAGPSAGLMFTLALYDRLTPDDLTDGRKIAGTGTIACGGVVGMIGGIEEKVAGAENQGADIFLAPEGNYAAAAEVADEIEVVSVATFDDAVEYLEGL